MARSKSKMAKPIKGSRPKTPHDGRVYQAGGALPGRTMSGMTKPMEGRVSASTGKGRRGC